MILASDGLWDLLSEEEAVRLVRAELRAYSDDAQMAAEKLVDVARSRHAVNPEPEP